MINKLSSIFLLPLLLGSVDPQLSKKDISNNRDYYQVIGATTGERIAKNLYAEERVIKTHIKVVSAIKKALANEGVDLTKVRFLLYYDGLTIDDSLPPRMWHTKSHPDTISSPWLDLTRTIATSGETKITIRIDATAARLLKDLFSKPEDKSNNDDFLAIPSIKGRCYSRILSGYRIAVLRGFNPTFALKEKGIQGAKNVVRKIYTCAPENLREPVLSLFRSSDHVGMGWTFGGFDYSVYNQLTYYCQDKAEDYYSELHPQLAVQGLQTLESGSRSEPKWWTEVIDQTKPLKEC